MAGYHAAAPPVVVLLLATYAANKTADEEATRPPSGLVATVQTTFSGALSPAAVSTRFQLTPTALASPALG